MLTWKRVDGSWLGNGFRIESSAPDTWALYEAERGHLDGVAAEPIPIASLPTLSACKYKAEHMHEDRQVNQHRQRLAAVALGSASLGLLSAASPIVAAGLFVITAASVLELAMTWFEDRVGRASEFKQ